LENNARVRVLRQITIQQARKGRQERPNKSPIDPHAAATVFMILGISPCRSMIPHSKQKLVARKVTAFI
jgi:hypothetical protein